MRVTVLGATGATGSLVVPAALAAGHEVTVLVRDPARLRDVDPAVHVEVGDARDPESAARAVAGAEAVISTIGTRDTGRSTLITDCMTTVVATLPPGVRRADAAARACCGHPAASQHDRRP